MPFLHSIQVSSSCRIGIWHISESSAQLSDMLPPDILSDSRLASFSAPSRRKEFLAVRCLLLKMTEPSLRIGYHNRKPLLINDNRHISIAHTRNYAAIAISDENTAPSAVDIEYESDRALHIADRFLAPHELLSVKESSSPENLATLIWSAKEAVFKTMDDGCYDFRSHIIVQHIDNSLSDVCGEFTATECCTVHKASYRIQYWNTKPFILTFASRL